MLFLHFRKNLNLFSAGNKSIGAIFICIKAFQTFWSPQTNKKQTKYYFSIMSFRKRKRIIEEESNDENEEIDEDDAPDVEPDQEPLCDPDQNREFKILTEEIPESFRNQILGGFRNLPQSRPLQQNSFSNPLQLWLDTYGDIFFHFVLDATNIKAEKLKSNETLFSRYFPLSINDIYEFFGHLLVMSVEKHPENIDVRKFFQRWNSCPKFLELEDYEVMPRSKFEFIFSNLDIGPDVYVPKADAPRYRVVDLGKKFNPILEHFNEISPLIKTPDRNFPLTIDEQLRGSYSKSSKIKNFMKGKPCKFGDKFFLLVDSDRFCLQMQLQMPSQFKNWDGLEGLLDLIFPQRFRNLGFTIVGDNYFFTLRQILKLLNENTSLSVQCEKIESNVF